MQPVLLALAASSVSAVVAAPFAIYELSPAAAGVVKMPLRHHLNRAASLSDTLSADLARLPAHRQRVKRQSSDSTYSIPAINDVSSYLATIGVGCPAKEYTLLVDTGSAVTWVGSDSSNPYVPTACSVDTQEAFNLTYGSGTCSGELYTDNVTLATGLTISSQGVGAANQSSFTGIDGILGVGPVAATVGSLFPNSSEEIPTVTDTAFSQGLIGSKTLGVYFQPDTTGGKQANGELTFGGVDESKLTNDLPLSWVPMLSPGYMGVNLSDVSVNGSSIGSGLSTIVDTGSVYVFLPPDVFSGYSSAITNASYNPNTNQLSFPKSSIDSVPDLKFTIGGNLTLTLNKYAQLVEQGLYETMGLDSDYHYSWVAIIAGEPFNALLGQKFMERYYAAFDLSENRIGFGSTNNSYPIQAP